MDSRNLATDLQQQLTELQAFHTRIAILQEVGTAISHKLTLDEILPEIGRRIKWLLDFDHCSIYLVQSAFFTTVFGPPVDKTVFNNATELNRIDWVLKTRQPYCTLESTADATASPFRSHMVIPMESENGILGTINFASHKSNAFKPDDLRISNLLAMSLAASIRNAQRYEEAKELYIQLEQTERLREDMTRMLMHDLRNPLGIIQGNFDLIKLTLDDPNAYATNLRRITDGTEAVRYTIQMIDDLLDVHRLDSGILVPKLDLVDIRDLFAEKEQLYKLKADHANITFTTSVLPHVAPVLADRRLLSRVIDNLVNNAFKYTHPGGKIELLAAPYDKALHFSVRDTGQGIPAEFQKKIFDKFFQVIDANGIPLRKGTGLGLAFCRLAVEAHSGKIWVTSALDKGSTFIFTIPLET
ncbi:MAG: GAF domain-containing protein [Anaerolineae bacterium]|nr:GAF domain-containing protein [Anaerolineae bacterium]